MLGVRGTMQIMIIPPCSSSASCFYRRQSRLLIGRSAVSSARPLGSLVFRFRLGFRKKDARDAPLLERIRMARFIRCRFINYRYYSFSVKLDELTHPLTRARFRDARRRALIAEQRRKNGIKLIKSRPTTMDSRSRAR